MLGLLKFLARRMKGAESNMLWIVIIIIISIIVIALIWFIVNNVMGWDPRFGLGGGGGGSW